MSRSSEGAPARGPRVSLLELMVFVGVAGASIGLARGAVAVGLARGDEDFWGHLSNLPAFDRAAGMAMVVLLCWMILPAARGAWRVAREGGARRVRAWPVAWRLLAVVGLVGLISGLMEILLLDPKTLPRLVTWPPMNKFAASAREAYWPVLAAVAGFGMAAAILPVGPRSARPRPMRWLIVPLALVAGAVLMAVMSAVPYLVLIAVDGMTAAFTSRSGRVRPDVFMRGAPPLNARLARAGWETLAAGVAVAATGSVVARDLRRDLSAEPATARGIAARVLLAALAGFAGWWLLFVTLPTVHPAFLEGLGYLVEPRDAALMVAAFATLAIGLSARSVTPSSAIPRPFGRMHGPARGAALVGLVALVTGSIGYTAVLVRSSDLVALPRLREVQQAIARGWVAAFSNPWLEPIGAFLRFDVVAYGVALMWLAWLVLEANVLGRTAARSPLDEVVGSRSRMAWFAWGAVGLTVACLAALPVLYLSGLSLMHVRLHSMEWFGWDLDR